MRFSPDRRHPLQLVDSPSSDDPYAKFTISVVGPRLRPANPDLGYTSDMCVPVYPNERHPDKHHGPVRPQSPDPDSVHQPFPFSDCYHWFGPDVQLCVRVRPAELDQGSEKLGSPRSEWTLPIGEYVEMQMVHAGDCERVAEERRFAAEVEAALAVGERRVDYRYEDEGSSMWSSETKYSSIVFSRNPDYDYDDVETADGLATAVGTPQQEKRELYAPFDRASNFNSSMTTFPSCDNAALAAVAYPAVGTVPWVRPADNVCTPVVDVWLNLSAHFAVDEDVPDPVDFLETYEEIVRYANVHLEA